MTILPKNRTTMRRKAGFSLLELMVSVSILVTVVGVSLSMLIDAQHAYEGVTDMADMQQNLRASMVNMQRDFIQAAEGLPTTGLSYPQGGTAKTINRPSPTGKAYVFPGPAVSSTIADITPGVGGTTTPGLTVNGTPTDFITVMYVDNSLVDANGHQMNLYPIYQVANAANPQACNGLIKSDGSSVTFDANCINITGNNSVQPGDLIMFFNGQNYAIQTVTSVAGQVASFAAGDAFNFNGMLAKATAGTLLQLQNGVASAGGPYPPTTAARVKMVTYYIDNVTNPLIPQLVRQVNFNTPAAVADGIEDLQISFGITQSNNVALYGAAGAGNAKQPLGTDSPSQIRNVNLFVGARSNAAYSVTGQFFRDNMITKVGVRSLSFVNIYK
jgi:prepilin-type N-terminal cleavage/methylation domain-containing protein